MYSVHRNKEFLDSTTRMTDQLRALHGAELAESQKVTARGPDNLGPVELINSDFYAAFTHGTDSPMCKLSNASTGRVVIPVLLS